MRSRIHRYLAASALLLLMCGCIKDYPGSVSPVESTIALRLSVPGGGNGGTRSIDAEPNVNGENRIDKIDILALTEKGDDNWVFDYRAENVTQIWDAEEKIMTVTARVRDMSTEQQFVILANASAELDAVELVRYENIAAIENRLICVTGGGEWPANNNGDGNFTPFPMYARTGAVTVGESKKEIGTFHLIRMVARIDVTLKEGLDNFELTEACLFNYRTAGYVSYANSGFDGAKAMTPAVPASGNPTGDPIRTVLYNADASGKILSSIYTFESPAITSDAGKTTGTALVIGGFFGSETVNKSYYRIDFKTADTNPSYISEGILRNHQYNVIIQKVNGSGSGTPLEAYLGGSQLSAKVEKWEPAGQGVIADGQYWLTVDKDEFIISTAGGGVNSVSFTAETNYNITTQGYPAGLQISTEYTSGSGWLTVSGGANGDTERTITVSAQANGSTLRTAKIKVKAGNMTKIINVAQYHYLPTYVGAFWRADQIGERVIKIDIGETDSFSGEWSAHIDWMSDDWNANDIVLAAGGSPDDAIYTANPGDAENYQVGGNATFVSGDVDANGSILFRIGLNSKWSDNANYNATTKPARYAVIVLSYKDNKITQKIFLRQGHEADYLIHPNDVASSDQTYVRKFSPYNLTAPGMSEADYTAISAAKGGTFAEYPSQVGALFQFSAISTHKRRAWHPTKTNFADWSYVDNLVWDETHETCPAGYRRPTIGGATSYEFAHSLLADPSFSGNLVGTENTSWGYLADGFFDRRAIVSSVTSVVRSAVEASSYKAAYIGRLFYNSKEGGLRENASIFFPASGFHFSIGGALRNVGSNGIYWSKAATGAWSAASNLNFSSDTVYPQGSNHRAFGLAVRCVRDE